MNKTLLILLFSTLFIGVKAQISYGSTDWGTYNMKINVMTSNDSIYLNIIYTDQKKKLTDTPKILFKLLDNTTVSLEGKLLGNTNKSDGGVFVYGVLVEDNHHISEAKFPITKEQIEQFSKGIKKVRLNTSPKYHEKEWRKDKIGKILYNAYLKCSKNSFEDGF